MALTDDQKKNLWIGGGVGALTLLGFWLFSDRKAAAAPTHAPDLRALPTPAPRTFPVSRRRSEPLRSRSRRDRDIDDERGERGKRDERGERGERGRRRGNRRGDNARGQYGVMRQGRRRGD